MNVEKLTSRINTKVRDIVSVLGRQTPQARQMLRKLLTEKIDLEPVGSGRARGYKFRGSLAVDRLISGDAIGTHLTVVAPTGFEPVFPPSPHAFASESRTYGVLSQRASGRDGNPTGDPDSAGG
jgi:hypothetical protein